MMQAREGLTGAGVRGLAGTRRHVLVLVGARLRRGRGSTGRTGDAAVVVRWRGIARLPNRDRHLLPSRVSLLTDSCSPLHLIRTLLARSAHWPCRRPHQQRPRKATTCLVAAHGHPGAPRLLGRPSPVMRDDTRPAAAAARRRMPCRTIAHSGTTVTGDMQ